MLAHHLLNFGYAQQGSLFNHTHLNYVAQSDDDTYVKNNIIMNQSELSSYYFENYWLTARTKVDIWTDSDRINVLYIY